MEQRIKSVKRWVMVIACMALIGCGNDAIDASKTLIMTDEELAATEIEAMTGDRESLDALIGHFSAKNDKKNLEKWRDIGVDLAVPSYLNDEGYRMLREVAENDEPNCAGARPNLLEVMELATAAYGRSTDQLEKSVALTLYLDANTLLQRVCV